MDGMTPERLAELRAVAEAAEPMMVFGGRAQTTFVSLEKSDVLALIAALEAKTAEVDAKADYVSDLEERVRQRDNHVIPVLHARIKEAERERDEARAEVDDLAADPGHKAAKYWKWWQREKARADRAETALERVRAWAFEEEDFTDSASPDYREGFRDAQKVTLGLVQAWGETGDEQ